MNKTRIVAEQVQNGILDWTDDKNNETGFLVLVNLFLHGICVMNFD